MTATFFSFSEGNYVRYPKNLRENSLSKICMHVCWGNDDSMSVCTLLDRCADDLNFIVCAAVFGTG